MSTGTDNNVVADLMQGPDTGPLPELVTVSQAFISRLPSQRVIDLMKKLQGDMTFSELMEEQPGRITAFRALMRDHPRRDPTSLWMHAYDVEVAIDDPDPTNGNSSIPSPPSAPITE
jgi:hypothetical protein